MRSEHINMVTTIASPAKYEMRTVIQFLQAEGSNAMETMSMLPENDNPTQANCGTCYLLIHDIDKLKILQI